MVKIHVIEKYSSFMALVANIGVILGIVFLSQEIRQSNRIATAQAELALSEQALDISRLTMEYSELRALFDEPDPELTAPQVWEAKSMALQFMNYWTSIESAYLQGLIREELFDVRLRGIAIVLNDSPGLAQFIASYIPQTNPNQTGIVVKMLVSELGKRGFSF